MAYGQRRVNHLWRDQRGRFRIGRDTVYDKGVPTARDDDDAKGRDQFTCGGPDYLEFDDGHVAGLQWNCVGERIMSMLNLEFDLLRVGPAMKAKYRIPQIPDPDWLPRDPEEEQPSIDEFSDEEWVVEMTRRWLRDMTGKYEQREGTPDVILDDTVVTR